MARSPADQVKNVNVISFGNEEGLANAAAAQWVQEIEAAARESRPHRVALSGGRIAHRFFSAAAALAKPQPDMMSSVQFFWSDERCISPTDPESNFAAARDLLLTPLGIPESQIHRLRGEDPPQQSAAAAEKELRAIAPANAAGQPVLDLIFLGLGEEGHVASLFPGESQNVADSPAVYRPITASKPPPLRITMGYQTIAAAKQVWVLASGAGKEGALRNSLSPNGTTPLARVLKSRSQTCIFTDIAV
jgi:6-phosphogluconolactonase